MFDSFKEQSLKDLSFFLFSRSLINAMFFGKLLISRSSKSISYLSSGQTTFMLSPTAFILFLMQDSQKECPHLGRSLGTLFSLYCWLQMAQVNYFSMVPYLLCTLPIQLSFHKHVPRTKSNVRLTLIIIVYIDVHPLLRVSLR